MSIAASLAAQSAISRINNADMAIIRSSQAESDLLNSGNTDFNAVARKEAQLQSERLRAETQERAARAELRAIKRREEKESKKNKLNLLA